MSRRVSCSWPSAHSISSREPAPPAGVMHGVGLQRRRASAVGAIKLAVDGGVIGEPRQFSARYLTDYAASPDVPFTWRYQRSLAGSGALGEIASHVIGFAR